MPLSRITIQKKTESISLIQERNINFIKIIISIILWNNRTVEDECKLIIYKVSEIWKRRSIRWDTNMSINTIQICHSTIPKYNPISLRNINNIKIAILTVKNTIIFGIIIHIFENIIFDNIYFLWFIDYLLIEYDHICCYCLCYYVG